MYQQLEKITSGNKMREILSKFYKSVPKEDIEQATYLSMGQLSSEYDSTILGMADKMVLRAINKASKKSEQSIKKDYKKLGDIGLTAEKYVSKAAPKLKLKEVFSGLKQIAETSGSGSQEKKVNILAGLLKKATRLEARYITRIVTGKLRLGMGDKTILDALSIAKTGSKKARKELEKAYHVCPDVGTIAKIYLTKGIKGFSKTSAKLNRPIQMMLCQRVKTISQAKDKLGLPVAVEFKYDGERVQAHKSGKKVKLFSRRLDETTKQFPDVVNLIKNVKAKNCIIDGEIVPLGKNNKMLPFQTLMQRKRKHGVEKYVKIVPVCLFAFDLLYLNGKSLLNKSYFERQSKLRKIINQSKHLKLATRKICKSEECIEDFFKQALKIGGEGIILKSLKKDSVYEAGKRGWNWIKWKPEYSKGLRDTFDLVVIGAYYGKGRRAGKYGALLCASYNKSKDCFETFCKVGSGFTDKTLKELTKKFKKYIKKTKPARVDITKNIKPDVYFTPTIVIEVVGAEITKSPNHTCAKQKGQGLALRFPRFLKFRAKKPEQATSTKEIKNMAK